MLHSTLIDSLFLKASKFDWFLLEYYIALSEILLTVSQGINLLFPLISGGGGGGGGALGGCVRPRSRARRTRVSPSDDYPAGRLQ